MKDWCRFIIFFLKLFPLANKSNILQQFVEVNVINK